MKRTYKWLIFMAGMPLFLSAQSGVDSSLNLTSEHNLPPVIQPRALNLKWSVYSDLLSGSNGMNQFMMNRLGLGGYMSPEEIAKAEKNIKNVNRSGFAFINSVFIPFQLKPDTHSRKKVKVFGILINQFSATGTKYSGDAFRLVFQGNELYLGKKLDLSNSGFIQYNVRNVGLGLSNLYVKKTGKWLGTLSGNVGISQILNYKKMKLKESWLYTDSNRNYIDIQYNGSYYNGGKDYLSGVGYGFFTGLNYTLNKRSQLIIMNVSNLGLYYIPDGVEMSKKMDAPTRINQKSIGVNSLNADQWFRDLKDTLNRELGPDSVQKSAWVMAPFRVNFKYIKGFKTIVFDYWKIPGFMPMLTFNQAFSLRSNSFWRPFAELQLGGFDNYNVNAGIKKQPNFFKTGKKGSFGFELNLRGVESLIFSSKQHGAGLFLNLQYWN